MKILMFLGFAMELCFFIITGVFLALGNVLASVISLLLAMGFALFTGMKIGEIAREKFMEEINGT